MSVKLMSKAWDSDVDGNELLVLCIRINYE